MYCLPIGITLFIENEYGHKILFNIAAIPAVVLFLIEVI
jgi:hypothetical protein